jgi:hypothetical protein
MIIHMLVESIVFLGVVAVLPLALGRARRWAVAAVAVVVSLLMPVGPLSAMVASVWLVITLMGVVELVPALRRAGRQVLRIDAELAFRAATGFAVVAAAAFVASRAGLELFGIGEPIVQLTAVHFIYAGVGAVTLAGAVSAVGPLGRIAVALTISAPPVVATGFLVRHPLPQVGGAVLMSAGVLVTAALQLRAGSTDHRPRSPGRVLLVVSGLAPWVPMGLAVAWAASLYWSVPALSVPDMARTHGVMNVVFVVAGLWSRRRDRSWSATAPTRASVVAAR